MMLGLHQPPSATGAPRREGVTSAKDEEDQLSKVNSTGEEADTDTERALGAPSINSSSGSPLQPARLVAKEILYRQNKALSVPASWIRHRREGVPVQV